MRPVTSGGSGGSGGGLTEPVTFTEVVTLNTDDNAASEDRTFQLRAFWGPGPEDFTEYLWIDSWGDIFCEAAVQAISISANSFSVPKDGNPVFRVLPEGALYWSAGPGAYASDPMISPVGNTGLSLRGVLTLDAPDVDHANADAPIAAPTLTVQANNGVAQTAMMEWKNDAGDVVFRMMNPDYWGDVAFEAISENIHFAASTATELDDGGYLTVGLAGVTLYAPAGAGRATLGLDVNGVSIAGAAGAKVGFFGTSPVVKPTGVPVTAQGIHDALVSLGLIAA